MSERRSPVAPRSALLRFGVSIVVTLLVLMIAAYEIGGGLARDQALNEARVRATAIADSLVAPLIDDRTRARDPAAMRALDRELGSRVAHGQFRHVKIWSTDGEVLWSDEHQLIGRRFLLEPDERRLFASGDASAEISELSRQENIGERAEGRLLEVYAAALDAEGAPILFEAYFGTDGVEQQQRAIATTVFGVAAGVLVLFAAAVLPLGVSLARRVERGRQERLRLTRQALSASDAERRLIARELHDGVIQDLAGVAYLVPELRKRAGQGRANATDVGTFDKITEILERDVASLRSMLVQIYPPDLEQGGLREAIEEFAQAAREAGLHVDVSVSPELVLPREVARLAYAVAREGIRNAVKHSRAERVLASVEEAGGEVLVAVVDDGVGLAEGAGLDTSPTGHLGLRLLHDSVKEIGGELTLASDEAGGARLAARFPAALVAD
jgi:signal transduction histidine kinase